MYNTSERLKRDQYRENNLLGAEATMESKLEVRECREEINMLRDQTRILVKNCRGYNRDNQTDLS